MTAYEQAVRFMKRHRMYYADLNSEEILSQFLEVMARDYADWKTSRRMIPTRIGKYDPVHSEKQVTVIDIGGTNVRSAVVTIREDGTMHIDDLLSFLTPGTQNEIDAVTFFNAIVRGITSHLKTDEIGICFSYASIPQDNRDAIVAAGGKQLQVPDLFGKKIGAGFLDAMLRSHLLPVSGKVPRITVINDTVAAALGGYTHSSRRPACSCIGFIYGTGMNICYQEQTGEWINTETGACNYFPTGDIDDAYDATLIDPGLDRLEKMVSGGYQGGLMEQILMTAAGEKELSEATIRNLSQNNSRENQQFEEKAGQKKEEAVLLHKAITARDISEFSNCPTGSGVIASACANENDRQFTAAICDLITERSACFCAIALTAAIQRSGCGHNHREPVFITAEGSTYQKQKDFAGKLEKQMQLLAGRRHQLHYEIHVIEDVILKGTAVACLMS